MGQNGINNTELDEEIIFKHAVYVSNQYKNNYLNTLPFYPTLLHKIIQVPKGDQLKTSKRSKFMKILIFSLII